MNKREKFIYLAGFLDGEGSITGWCAKEQKKRGVYNLKIYTTSTNKEVTEWIKSNFGGLIYVNRSPSRKPHWKTSYIWCIERPKTKEFLEQILPYLIIKKKQAEVALKLRETFSKRYRNLPKKIADLRYSLIQELHILNSRGHI